MTESTLLKLIYSCIWGTRVSKKFCNILVCAHFRYVYYVAEAVYAKVVPAMVDSIMVVGALAHGWLVGCLGFMAYQPL